MLYDIIYKNKRGGFFMIKRLLKKENGAITLFVLLAMLFFMIAIFSLFVASSNKEQSQASEVDKIKQE